MEASDSSEITTEFEGTTFYFCSSDCRDFFEEHPK
ncbi:YHS domain-containing protein [Haloarcula sp. S1CR25-12]|jgi:YHS domain-containing protein|nr:YHS domain-containing protein [Haloarcula sp. S1CR25-12]MDS0261821.1 YHS domain-containing protein [Haloarcula sp. S1CR25-12]